MGLGEAASNSQLCSFPLECSAAELIVSKTLRWIQKPFAQDEGMEKRMPLLSFSLSFLFFSFLLLLFYV